MTYPIPLLALLAFAAGVVLVVTSPWGPCGVASPGGFVGEGLVVVSVLPLLKAVVSRRR